MPLRERSMVVHAGHLLFLGSRRRSCGDEAVSADVSDDMLMSTTAHFSEVALQEDTLIFSMCLHVSQHATSLRICALAVDQSA